ncbi:MAG: S49 family peptidase [Rhabdochlamydiaceae bacterium]|jgi:signal peptide peptidase SppA
MHFTRESVFVGAVRSFCSSFALIVGLSLGLLVVFMGITMVGGNNYLPPKSELTVMPDAHGNRAILPANAPVILRIDFSGVIGVGDLTAEKIQDVLLDSQEDMLKGNRVKGILLRINSPGGVASEADSIYKALVNYKDKYKVPIYTYVDGICASGGVYIACASDKIYATPSSIIGSVGVRLGPNFNFADAMTKIGVSALTLTAGKDKDELNPFRPWGPSEGASIQTVILAMYDQFIGIVSKARPKLTKEKLVGEYGANIFIAQTAETYGYIDHANSDYNMSLMDLTHAAGIDGEQPYQVVQLSSPNPFYLGSLNRYLSRGKSFIPSIFLTNLAPN